MKRWIWTFALWSACLGQARGDAVTLDNGDRLSGRIKSLKEGKLTLATGYAGDVAIDWGRIAEVSSESPLTARFVSGKAVAGRISTPEPGLFEVTDPEGAAVRVSPAEVVSLSPPPKAEQPLGLLEGWHGSADLGFSVTRGNSEVSNLSFSVKPERRTRTDRLTAGFTSLRNTQDGRVASNLYRGRLRYERYLSPRTYLFGQGGFEKDERQRLDLRTSQGAGLGFRWEPGPETQFSVFAGATFLQEKFTGRDQRQLAAEGLAGFELETSALRPFVLSTKTQFLPILTDDRYRLEWDGGVRLPLFANLTVGLQLFDYYDSDPPEEGVEKNDFGVISTLGWTF